MNSDRVSSSQRRQVMTIILLVVTFLLSRLFFWFLGVRFDAYSLPLGWHFLDVDVLRTRLLPGLINLHSQPPGYNLLLGIVLKVCPDSPSICLNFVYLLFGFVLHCTLYLYLRLSSFSRTCAIIFTLMFMASPNAILYENVLTETYPIAVIIAVAALALRRFQDKPVTLYASVFLFLCACVCLTHSMFHLVFLAACAPFALIPQNVRWRRVAACSMIALGLVSTLYLKNLERFGFFGSSSWFGMNLFRIAAHSVGTNTVKDLVYDGKISGVASVLPFSPLAKYSGVFKTSVAHCLDSPELTVEVKPSGSQNLNNEAYIAIAKEYRGAALYIISHYPRSYWRAVVDSWRLYFTPSWGNLYLLPNLEALPRYISMVSRFPFNNIILLPAIFIVACLRSLVHFYHLVRYRDTDGLAFLFMTMAVMYVAVVGNAVEYGENNRFRMMTNPLIFLLAAVMCREAWSRVASVMEWRMNTARTKSGVQNEGFKGNGA